MKTHFSDMTVPARGNRDEFYTSIRKLTNFAEKIFFPLDKHIDMSLTSRDGRERAPVSTLLLNTFIVKRNPMSAVRLDMYEGKRL